ncbi:MAG: hypothetical protein CSB55_05050 [Candidatus Cloacimonadota bacterium]|nr:MAG: hypothetical protein CSB55_05050 [Candidatus Cloacimonadota bacterium]
MESIRIISKFTILLLIIFLVGSFELIAEETNSADKKLDKILENQKELKETAYSLRQEYKNKPLEGKKYGIEINPFLLIAFNQLKTLSGSFSIFKPEKNTEISFPFMYSDNKFITYSTDFDNNKSTLKIITASSHWRKFLGNTCNGFYISASARLENINYDIYRYSYGYRIKLKNIKGNRTLLGIGFGIGYRVFSYKGFYWGTGLTLGKYLAGNFKIKDKGDEVLKNHEIYFNFELLKFGWAF